MKTFALLTEGVSDQRVLKSVLIGFMQQFEDEDEPEILPVFPPPAPPGGTSQGGWTLLLAQLEAGGHLQALQTNDYVVVHIDTDVANDPGFDVPTANLSAQDIRAAVIARLEQKMGPAAAAACAGRILYAIAVHSIECWLLPIVFSDGGEQAQAKRLIDCQKLVNERLNERDEPLLSGTTNWKDKEPRRYEELSKPYKKWKALKVAAPKNPSLKLFVDDLERVVKP